MSLQGSIETFAIADVLRLLAATSKSGRLHVQGASRAGTVWVDGGRILAAESPSTPHVEGPVDVLFQLLRFGRGSFRFELDKQPAKPGEPLEIDSALGDAESMLAEWRELEANIPGPDAWVQLAGSLREPSVTLEAEEWTTLVAVSGGRTVAQIGDVLETGELKTARALARLLELSLIGVSAKAPAGAVRSISSAPTASPSSIEAPADAPAPSAPPAESNDEHQNGVVERSNGVSAKLDKPVESDRSDNGSNGTATAPERNGSVVPITPPAPPAPPAAPTAPVWTPTESGSTTWSTPDFPSLTPPPPPAPPAPALFEAPRAEAGLLNPKPGAEFVPPPETGLDGDAVDPYSYTNPGARSDVYTYPPVADPAPTWEPAAKEAAPSAPASSGPADSAGPADVGYPPLPPPLPPVYGSPTAAPILPGVASATPAAPAKADSWIGPLADAIAKADTPDGAAPAPIASGLVDLGAPPSTPPTVIGKAEPLAPAPAAAPAIAPDLAVPPPPPAPPAPVGSWTSPASLFEAGGAERLAPPPPPPPPPVATALQSLADPSVPVSPSLLNGAVNLTDTDENAEDIERQLFNLSPRAREAVKQSSGLYDGRGRR